MLRIIAVSLLSVGFLTNPAFNTPLPAETADSILANKKQQSAPPTPPPQTPVDKSTIDLTTQQRVSSQLCDTTHKTGIECRNHAEWSCRVRGHRQGQPACVTCRMTGKYCP